MLQFRVSFSERRKVHPRGVRAGQAQRRGLTHPGFLLLFTCLLPAEPALGRLGYPRRGRVCFTEFSLQVASFLLFYFHGLFPFFVFKPSPFWTASSHSNYLTITTDTGSKILTHRMKGVHGRLWGAVGFSSRSVATLLCQASKT